MTITSKYIVTSSSGPNQLGFDLDLEDFSLRGQSILFSGSTNVDGLRFAPGITVDLSNTKGRSDEIILSGSFSDYLPYLSINDSGLLEIAKPDAEGNTQTISLAVANTASDTIVFDDFSFTTKALSDALYLSTRSESIVLSYRAEDFLAQSIINDNGTIDLYYIDNGQLNWLKVNSQADKTLVFSDGQVSVSDFANAVSNTTNIVLSLLSDQNLLPSQILVADATQESNLTNTDTTVKAISFDNTGENFVGFGQNTFLNVSGANGVDRVYVRSGSKIDASNLKSGRDEIYFTGDWADYTKTIQPSGNILFSRTVEIDGQNTTEEVVVANGNVLATRDLLIFTDGAISTRDAFSGLKQSLDVALSALQNVDSTKTTTLEDYTPPTITVTSDVNTVNVGDTAQITFTLSEVLNEALTLSDINVSGGTLDNLVQNDLVYTATFTPNAQFEGTINLSINGLNYQDEAGNTGADVTFSQIAIDTLPATLTATTFNIDENLFDVATLSTSQAATLSLENGGDNAFFTLTNDTLSFITAPDFESDQTNYTVSVSLLDASGNLTTENVTVTVNDVVEAPQLSSALSDLGAGQLDVRVPIVFKVDEAVEAVTGKAITFTDNTAAGMLGETQTNNFSVDVTSKHVVIDNDKGLIIIYISDDFDLDLASNYTMSIDEGAFVSTTTGLATSGLYSIDFDTVNPTSGATELSDITNAQMSYQFDLDSGNLVASSQWVSLEGLGNGMVSGSVATLAADIQSGHVFTLDASGGEFVFVLSDVSERGGDPNRDGGIQLLSDFSALITGFGADDRIYVDDPFNDTANQNVVEYDFFTYGNGAQGTELFAGFETVVGDGRLYVQLADEVTATSPAVGDVNHALGVTPDTSIVSSDSVFFDFAPTAFAIAPQTFVVDDSVSISIKDYFSDVNGAHTLNYSVSGILPAGLSLVDGVISGTVTAAANTTVQVSATDHTGNTVSTDIQWQVYAPPVITTELANMGDKALDVRSQLVLKVDQDVEGVSGKTITLTDNTSSGYRGEAQQNHFTIDVTSDLVTIDNANGVIIINVDAHFDLDLSSNYTLSIDEGAFVSTESGLEQAAFADVSFNTVSPTTGQNDVVNALKDSDSSAALSYVMDASGNLIESSQWVDIEGLGNGTNSGSLGQLSYDIAANRVIELNAGDGEYVFVFADKSTAGGTEIDNAGILVDTDFAVLLSDFGANDLIYIDDAFNDSEAINNLTAEFFMQGNGTKGAELFVGLTSESGGDPRLYVELEGDLTANDETDTFADSSLENVNDTLGHDDSSAVITA